MCVCGAARTCKLLSMPRRRLPSASHCSSASNAGMACASLLSCSQHGCNFTVLQEVQGAARAALQSETVRTQQAEGTCMMAGPIALLIMARWEYPTTLLLVTKASCHLVTPRLHSALSVLHGP